MRLLPSAGMTRAILPGGLLREPRSRAPPPYLRMHVFGEPVVGQLDAYALGARLGEHVGARSGELQSRADVVHEAGDLAIAFTSGSALGEHIGKVGIALHAHAAIVPPAARRFALHVWRVLHDVVVVLRLPAIAQYYAVATLQHLGVDLLRLEAAQVQARPEPTRL